MLESYRKDISEGVDINKNKKDKKQNNKEILNEKSRNKYRQLSEQENDMKK